MTTRLAKPVRRELAAAAMGLRYNVGRETAIVIEISPAGLSFREKGRRFSISLPWREAYRLAEHHAGELAHKEKLRDAAIARHARRA